MWLIGVILNPVRLIAGGAPSCYLLRYGGRLNCLIQELIRLVVRKRGRTASDLTAERPIGVCVRIERTVSACTPIKVSAGQACDLARSVHRQAVILFR
jgi:hypothetical protein